VIRFPSGQDHDTHRIARFSTEWRRRAGVYSRAKELERLGRSIINLELATDFSPCPPVVDALRDAVAAGRTAIFHAGVPLCAKRSRSI